MIMDPKWTPDRLFKVYLRDYLIKKGLHGTAQIFQEEAQVEVNDRIYFDTPDGFLHEWWCYFTDKYTWQVNQQNFDPESFGKAALPLIPDDQMPTSDQRMQQFQVSPSFNQTMGCREANEGLNLVPVNRPNNLVPTSLLQAPNNQQQRQVLQTQNQQALFDDQIFAHKPTSQTSAFPGTSTKFNSQDSMTELSDEDCQIIDQMTRTIGHQYQPDQLQKLQFQEVKKMDQMTRTIEHQNQQDRLQFLGKKMDQMTRTSEYQYEQDQLQKLQLQAKKMNQVTRTIEHQHLQDDLKKLQFQFQECVDSKPIDESIEYFLFSENEHDHPDASTKRN